MERLTELVAGDLVGAVVLTVVEVVASQRGADAAAVIAPELVLLAPERGRDRACTGDRGRGVLSGGGAPRRAVVLKLFLLVYH